MPNPPDRHAHTGHGWVTARADGFRARCGGPHVCADCALEAILAVDAGAEPSPQAATELFVGLRGDIARLTQERNRYREVLAVIANLGDGDCTSPGVMAMRNYARRMLNAAQADFPTT